jgi:hypothetical protein
MNQRLDIELITEKIIAVKKLITCTYDDNCIFSIKMFSDSHNKPNNNNKPTA